MPANEIITKLDVQKDNPLNPPKKHSFFGKYLAKVKASIGAKTAARKDKAEQLKTASPALVGEDIIIPTKPNERVYNPFDWIIYVLRWSTVQTIIPIVVAAVMWLMVYANTQRPLQVLEIPATMQERMYNAFKASRPSMLNPKIEMIGLRRFVKFTLRELNTLSPDYFSTDDLNGVVNPKILALANEGYTQNIASIKENALTRNLTVTAIDPLVLSDSLTKRYSAYVQGYITETAAQRSKPQQTRILPYRALVSCVIAAETPENRTGFYLVTSTEAFGESGVKEFDAARQTTLKERGLK